MLAVALAIAAIIAIGCALYPRRGELSDYERRQQANAASNVVPFRQVHRPRT